MVNKNYLWVVIGVTVIVSLAVSLIATNITGNVVIKQGFGSKVNVATNAEVLNMLNKCYTNGGNLIGSTMINSLVVGSNNLDTCNEFCTLQKGTCTQGYIAKSDISGVEAGFIVSPISCSTDFNKDSKPTLVQMKAVIYCTCCSP